MHRRSWLPFAVLVAGGSPAAAQPIDYVVVDPPLTRAAAATRVIFLNRCAGGCSAVAGGDDARANESSILGRSGIPTSVSIDPFQWDQATWDGMVACVRERYAPFDVTVVTDEPASGRYLEVMTGGSPSALNLATNTLGVAPLTNNCSALPSAIAFVFANAHAARPEQVEELCTTVIHEAGHLYGLDHAFACKDPMTYLGGCGSKVFVNRHVACGETQGERACQCGAAQNSFVKLLGELGAGTPPPAPTVRIEYPAEGAMMVAGFSVFAMIESARPVTELTLWANGRSLVRRAEPAAGSLLQLDTPIALPDGVIELEVRSRDDLGQVGVVTRRVTKGAACVDGSTCAGLTCVAGACVSPPGTAAIGAACETDEACASRQCTVADGVGVCSVSCYPEVTACDPGFACRAADDESFACLVEIDEGGGCCSTGAGAPGSLALAGVTAALLARRRRRHGTPSMQQPAEQN